MNENKNVDFIVVGAGSAGCVVASRLSEDPATSVMLLEAGPAYGRWFMAMPLAWRDTYQDPKVNWGYSSEPEPHGNNRRIPAPRGKVLGGSSAVNGMMYARGNPADYDQWRQMGLTGWSYSDVLPYFRRSETNWRGESEHHGASGPLTVSRHKTDGVLYPAFIETAEKLGERQIDDFHGETTEGWSVPDFTTHAGQRGSTYERYLKPAMRRANLRVETEAQTQRILLEGGRAIGVVYRKGGQTIEVRANREVIVCGGTYGSPQLLMLSGIGAAADLAALGIEPRLDLPAVGQNLQDHQSTGVLFAAKGPVTFDSQLRLDRMLLSVLRWRLFGSGPAAGLPVAAMGFYKTRPELDRPDIQMLISPVGMDAKLWFPGWRKPRGHVFSVAQVLLYPESRGTVTLASADPADAPKIRFNLLAAPADLLALRTALKRTRQFFATEPAASLVSREAFPGPSVATDEQLDAHLRNFTGTAFHPVGTCAMGAAGRGVVDERLKVHGVEGLRVVDASVMPVIVGGNTNAPAIMIAEKAADTIRGTMTT